MTKTYWVHENEMLPSDCDAEGMVEVIPAWEADDGCEGSMAFHLSCQADLIEELTSALKAIRDGEGKVCEEFELCNHLACDSSCTANLIAGEALEGNWDRDEHIERITRQRDMWHRLFNRLDGAVNHHYNVTFDGFTETHDEALYQARRRIYEEAARQGKEERERG